MNEKKMAAFKNAHFATQDLFNMAAQNVVFFLILSLTTHAPATVLAYDSSLSVGGT